MQKKNSNVCLGGCTISSKATFFEKKFLHSRSPSGTLHSKKFQKTWILVFEVIVQPPKHTFKIGIFFLIIVNGEKSMSEHENFQLCP